MGFNRNIVTAADVAAYAVADQDPARMPLTFRTNPPAGIAAPLPIAAAPGGVAPTTQDDYLTKVLKYVPLEIVGAYLFMAGVIDSNVTDGRAHAIWLAALLVGMAIITVFYDLRVLEIKRNAQIAISVIGLGVYVFAVGGWFATTTWYHSWYGSIALPLFALLVAIVKLKPIKTEADQDAANKPAVT